jgi:hypothetical protein
MAGRDGKRWDVVLFGVGGWPWRLAGQKTCCLLAGRQSGRLQDRTSVRYRNVQEMDSTTPRFLISFMKELLFSAVSPPLRHPPSFIALRCVALRCIVLRCWVAVDWLSCALPSPPPSLILPGCLLQPISRLLLGWVGDPKAIHGRGSVSGTGRGVPASAVERFPGVVGRFVLFPLG